MVISFSVTSQNHTSKFEKVKKRNGISPEKPEQKKKKKPQKVIVEPESEESDEEMEQEDDSEDDMESDDGEMNGTENAECKFFNHKS